MSRGLAAVTGRPGQRRRLWVLLALAGLVLVSPLESGLLPGRLGEVLEPSPAEAQTPPLSFEDGTSRSVSRGGRMDVPALSDGVPSLPMTTPTVTTTRGRRLRSVS